MTTFLLSLPWVAALIPTVGMVCVGLHRYHHEETKR